MIDSSPIITGRRIALTLAATLVAAVLVPLAPAVAQVPNPSPTPTPDTGTTVRLAGESRFDTAEKIAADAFPNGSENAILVRGDTFPDALAGAFLAGVKAGPILLTSTDSIPAGTEKALNRVTKKVFVIGGTSAVSETVVAQLKADGLEVQRIAGEGRYDTARKVAVAAETAAGSFKDLTAPQPPPGSPTGNPQSLPTAFLATGDAFADALASGPLAYAGKHPVVLTRSDTLSDEAKAVIQDEAIGIGQLIIVGGRKAVSTAVEEQVKALGKKVFRVSGADRLSTAAELAKLYVANQPTSPDPNAPRFTYRNVDLALGQNFPDALALGPHGGVKRSVILLAQTPEDLGDVTRGFIGERCNIVSTIVIAGGKSVISDETEAAAGEAAICGTAQAFELLPQAYTRLVGEEHVVTVSVTDQTGMPVAGTYVKLDIYRNTTSTPPEQPESPVTPPTASVTGKTAADGTVALKYAYAPNELDPREPPPEAHDLLIACAHPREGFPSPCLAEAEQNENMLMTTGRARWYQNGFRTALDGASVVPGPGHETAVGTAVVAFTIVPGVDGGAATTKLCWMVDLMGLDEDKPTLATIKKGPVGEEGVLSITLKPAPDADGFSQNCAGSGDFASGASASSRIKDIQDNPTQFYVQVDTEAFPGGAVRGQVK